MMKSTVASAGRAARARNAIARNNSGAVSRDMPGARRLLAMLRRVAVIGSAPDGLQMRHCAPVPASRNNSRPLAGAEGWLVNGTGMTGRGGTYIYIRVWRHCRTPKRHALRHHPLGLELVEAISGKPRQSLSRTVGW